MCIPLGEQFPFPSTERSFRLPGPAYSPLGVLLNHVKSDYFKMEARQNLVGWGGWVPYLLRVFSLYFSSLLP